MFVSYISILVSRNGTVNFIKSLNTGKLLETANFIKRLDTGDFHEIIIITRRRRRGTIEMTLVRPCVRPSFRLSVLPKSCPSNSSYIFCRINLKFCTLFSYDIVHVIFYFCFGRFLWSYGPFWLHPCSRNSCHIFNRIELKLCRMFCHDLKMCVWFGVFNCHIFDKAMAFCHVFGIFPTFEPFVRENWFFVYY